MTLRSPKLRLTMILILRSPEGAFFCSDSVMGFRFFSSIIYPFTDSRSSDSIFQIKADVECLIHFLHLFFC